jgi:HSP20 family protein
LLKGGSINNFLMRRRNSATSLICINARFSQPLTRKQFELRGAPIMAENITKVPVKQEKIEKPSSTLQAWQPFEGLRNEIDRLFDDFGRGFWRPSHRSFFPAAPIFQRQLTWPTMPAVDVVETEKAYEITAELPGMDEKNIEVKVADGVLTIKGEKHEEKEQKEKDYYLQERSFGSFERSFEVPNTVETDKIEASFKKGVLTLTLPKKAEAQKPAKKIDVKAA